MNGSHTGGLVILNKDEIKGKFNEVINKIINDKSKELKGKVPEKASETKKRSH